MTRSNLFPGFLAFFLVAVSLSRPSALAAAPPTFVADGPNPVVFPAQEAKFIRVVILASSGGQPCIDELEIYGPDGKQNLALASGGAKATASSCLPGYPIHQIAHLNDGLYGNSHSWIAAGEDNEWAQIELPAPAKVCQDRLLPGPRWTVPGPHAAGGGGPLSLDGKTWKTAAVVKSANFAARPAPAATRAVPLPDPVTWDGLVRYAFLCERKTWQRISPGDHISPLRVERPAVPGGPPYWGRIARLHPLARTLVLMEEMLARLAAKGLDVKRGAVAVDRTLAVGRPRWPAKAEPDDSGRGIALPRRPHGQAAADVPRSGPGRPRADPLRQSASLSLVAQL